MFAGICGIVPLAKPIGMMRPSGATQRSEISKAEPPTGS